VSFRVATLNLAQAEKRWEERRELIVDQLGDIRPDIFTLNEIAVALDTGRWIQQMAKERLGIDYVLLQQPRTETDAEGILTTYPVIETDSFQFREGRSVAQLARLDIHGKHIDLCVTHLYRSRGEDSLRERQVKELLLWVIARKDTESKIVCGDFNASLEQPSARLMTETLRPTQTESTAFTPLREVNSSPAHPYWQRFDRCIDFIWVTKSLKVLGSGLCFNKPAANDSTLWPSDHVGVWADLEF